MIAKEPPREKIFEAWSAVASGRVQFAGAPDAKTGDAEVESSNGEKKYFVSWSDGRYGSDDPATWWQKYPGYPILAVLMLQGKLPYDAKIASLFKNVNWTDANAAARRDSPSPSAKYAPRSSYRRKQSPKPKGKRREPSKS